MDARARQWRLRAIYDRLSLRPEPLERFLGLLAEHLTDDQVRRLSQQADRLDSGSETYVPPDYDPRAFPS